MNETTSEDVIHFWFEEITFKEQWQKDPAFDQMITERFGEAHARAMRGELAQWRETPEGRLAEVILLDQFSRNMFRDTPEAFASDERALKLAQEAVAAEDDEKLEKTKRGFLYMPYMHSESKEAHEEAVKLFEYAGSMEYELKHKAIIDQFGRYPHRNVVLGRESTPEEIEFLKEKGSSF